MKLGTTLPHLLTACLLACGSGWACAQQDSQASDGADAQAFGLRGARAAAPTVRDHSCRSGR